MAQNPYQMDPFLAQGFSNLTKALIGDPETDYQVARTNRVKTLLPYEQAQLEAAAAADTSLASQRDEETAGLVALNEALKILESDPTVSAAFIEPLGLPKTTPYGQPINIDPAVTGAMLRAILQGGNPDQRASALDIVGGGGARRQAEDFILYGTDDQAARGALFSDPSGGQFQNPGFAMQQLQGNLKLGYQESEDDLIADKNEDKLRYGEGGQGDRDAKIESDTKIKIAGIEAEALKEWKSAVADITTASAETIAKIEDDFKREELKQNQTRLKNESVFSQYITLNDEMIVSPELGKKLGISPNADGKYTMSFGNTESMIDVEIENPNGTSTIVKIAPENIQKLNPVTKNGKLVIPDGHKFNALDPKNAKGRVELIDQEIQGAVDSGLFADVPSAVMRKIQSNYTTAAENRDVEDVLRLMRRQLSETYKGETAVTIREGINFDVPAYIINFLVQPNANLDPNIITNTYGFSLDHANKIIRFVRAQ